MKNKTTALIWKEWRELRGFCVLAICVMVLIKLGLLFLREGNLRDYIDWNVGIAANLLPVVLALIALMPFCNEFRTLPYLLSRPARRGQLFWVKVGVSAVAFCLLIVVSHLIFIRGCPTPDGDPIRDRVVVHLICYGGMFFSALVVSALAVRKSILAWLVSYVWLGCVFVMLAPVLVLEYIVTYSSYHDSHGPNMPLIYVTIIVCNLSCALYLWYKSVTKFKRAAWPLTLFSVGAVALVWVLYLVFSFYVDSRFEKTMAAAKKAGILLAEDKVRSKPVPTRENRAQLYRRILSQLDRIPTRYRNRIQNCFSYWKLNGGSKAELRALFDAVKDRPEVVKTFEMLDKSGEFPQCSFSTTVNWQFQEWHIVNDLQFLANLVNLKLMNLVDVGRYQEAIDLAAKGMLIADAFKNEPGVTSYCCSYYVAERIVNTIRDFPPDVRWVKALLAMQACLSKEDIEMVANKEFSRGFYRYYGRLLKGGTVNINPDITQFYDLAVFRPIVKLDAVCLLDSQLETGTGQEDGPKSVLESSVKLLPLGNYVYRECFISQRHHDPQRLVVVLALKAYQAEHGDYPEVLKALVPDFLPEIPVDPATGLSFTALYRKGKIYSGVYRGIMEQGGGIPSEYRVDDKQDSHWLRLKNNTKSDTKRKAEQ